MRLSRNNTFFVCKTHFFYVDITLIKYIVTVCELFIEISTTAATVQLVVLRHDKIDETIEGIFFGHLLINFANFQTTCNKF